MLSGGAALGVHHIGLIKTLNQHDLLPRIICGSSAGSIVACFLCTRPMEELEKMIKPGGIKFDMIEFEDQNVKNSQSIVLNAFSILYSYLKKGNILKIEKLIRFMQINIGDMTFQQAFDRTGWVLNITVCGQNQQDDSMILNYLTAPNILIWSACAASCAVPHIFKAVQLMCKNSRGEIVEYGAKFVDGSVWQDLPLERMSQLFNINTFIVSQVNPYVIPFIAGSDGGGVLGRGYRDTWLTNLKQFFYEQSVHRIRQCERIINPPTILKRIFNIFKQNYHGTVTISPNPKVSDYAQLLSNPNQRMVTEAIIQMSRRTYQKIALIRGVYGIERQLDRFYQNLKQQLRALDMHQQRKGRKIKKGLKLRNNITIFDEYGQQVQDDDDNGDDNDQDQDKQQRQKFQDNIQQEIQQNTTRQCILSLHKNYFLRFETQHRKLQVNKTMLKKLYEQNPQSIDLQSYEYLISPDIEQQQIHHHWSQSYISQLDELISNDANDSQYSCPERGMKFIRSSQNLATIRQQQLISNDISSSSKGVRAKYSKSFGNLNKKNNILGNSSSLNDIQSIISEVDQFKLGNNDQDEDGGDENSENSESVQNYYLEFKSNQRKNSTSSKLQDDEDAAVGGIPRISSYMIPRTDSHKILARSKKSLNNNELSPDNYYNQHNKDDDNNRYKFQNKNKIKY